MVDATQRWRDGLPDELAFWADWFATEGGQWPDSYKVRRDPQRPIEDWLLVHMADPSTARILDVGSGPLTYLGCTYRGRRLDITACDPLAAQYAEMARRHGVSRPVEPIIAHAEGLTEVFPENSFDLVHASNALDHSYDPVRAIAEMIAVARLEGVVILRHFPNEAVKEGYHGLHQWNFDEQAGRAILWRPDTVVDLTDRFGMAARRHERWVIMTLRKREPILAVRSRGPRPERPS